MTEGNTKNKNYFGLIALFLMIVVLPAGSWFYLNDGAKYRISAMEELQSLGQLSSAEIGNQNLTGSLVIAGFVSTKEEEATQAYGNTIQKLSDQFSDRQRVFFTLFNIDGQSSLNAYANKFELKDNPQVLLLDEPVDQVEKLAKESYKLPLEQGMSLDENPYLVLLDTTLTIRNYYDMRELAEMKKLVRHITRILPPSPKKDIILKREKEK